jgi:hypothetical protein
MNRVLLFALFCGTGLNVTAQTPAAPVPADLQAVISSQFGEGFTIAPGFPVLTGDFNGDGNQDAVVVVTSHDAIQATSSRYTVLDPQSDFFGISDLNISTQFANPYPGGRRYLLVLHGNGTSGWRSSPPKDRFVLINVPFDRISLGHFRRKKHDLDDIAIEETGVLNAFLYWDGHKYKWQPGPASD